MTVFGDKVFKEVVTLNEVVRVSPNLLYKRRIFGYRQTEGKPCEDRRRRRQKKPTLLTLISDFQPPEP